MPQTDRTALSMNVGKEFELDLVINNGVVSQWRYSDGTIVPGSLGTFKGADAVDDVELSIHFSYRSKVTGSSNAPNILSGNTQ